MGTVWRPLAVILAGALTAACMREPAAPTATEVSYLYSQTAESARLEAAAGADAYTLILEGVDEHTVEFADRPARHARIIPTAGFVETWDRLFGDDSPNAALVEHEGRAGATDTLVVTLAGPVYDPGGASLRYDVTVLADEQHPERLEQVGGARHAEPPDDFARVSLFIDDATYPIVNGCTIGPYTSCPGKDLSNANLSWAFLDHANLSGANLSGADLTRASLVDANLSNANLTGAGLFAANVSGTNLSGVTLCLTTMPNGDLDNSGC